MLALDFRSKRQRVVKERVTARRPMTKLSNHWQSSVVTMIREKERRVQNIKFIPITARCVLKRDKVLWDIHQLQHLHLSYDQAVIQM
jgi:hypothetical protein